MPEHTTLSTVLVMGLLWLPVGRLLVSQKSFSGFGLAKISCLPNAHGSWMGHLEWRFNLLLDIGSRFKEQIEWYDIYLGRLSKDVSPHCQLYLSDLPDEIEVSEVTSIRNWAKPIL